MWTIYGVDSPNVEGVTNPKHIVVGTFAPSANISKTDFNNDSNKFLYIGGVSLGVVNWVDDGGTLSKYCQEVGTNLLGYSRFNILHRKDEKVAGTHIINTTYKYDGCAYTWIYESGGTNVYFLNGFRHGTQMYHQAPFYPTVGSNIEIKKDRVLSCRLVATADDNGELSACRPLWQVDFTGTGDIDVRIQTQYFLGPMLPTSLIKAWIFKEEQENEDKPEKPSLNPEDADQHEVETAGFTWLNNFKIMDWTDNAWPRFYLLDNKFATGEEHFYDYLAYNQFNDHDEDDNHRLYHVENGVGSVAPILRIQKNLNDNKAEWGSDIGYYVEGTESDTGYFTTHNNDIDLFPEPVNYDGMRATFQLDCGEVMIDYTHQASPTAPSNITRVRIYSGSTFFSIAQNYSLDSQSWRDTLDLSDPHGFGYGVCIVRRRGEYYLGGIYKYGSWAGFGIFGQITNLKGLPGFDSGNPGTPKTPTNPDADPNGVDPDAMNDTFTDGTGTEPNPTTENLINDSIGDAPSDLPDGRSNDDGSPFNPDGTPKNPADYDTHGTGEKNTNPVDVHDVPNNHDGSMGNGNGNPHHGDEKIPDPAESLPDTIDVDGTVTGAGILSVFTPTLAQLNTFTAELLSNTVLDSIKNFFTTNPMDGIFGLHILPYSGFADTALASPRIGTHTFSATLYKAKSEFLTIDYGEVTVPFIYDGYENYAPNSDVKLFLPFLGTKDIDINIIQGCKCSLKYNVSLVTGDIYAYLYCTWASSWGDAGNDMGIDHLVYSWQGNCAATIPLSHLDSTNYISGAMQVAGGITSLVAGAAAANPYAIPAGVSGLANGVAEIGRTNLITSGNLSGMAAFMGCREPFFIFSRPIIAFNNNYNHYYGLRSNAICKIGDLRDGTFTMMRNVDLKGVNATQDELNEIESILKGGFYI